MANDRWRTNDERPMTNAALRLETNGQTFLIAPTLNTLEMRELLDGEAVLDAEVAVLPNGMEQEFLERVTPETVILFVGRRPEDKPTQEMLKMMEAVAVLRTDERGTITFVFDGDQMRVLVQK